jgi:transcriptional regulator with XRE-family HTH domain
MQDLEFIKNQENDQYPDLGTSSLKIKSSQRMNYEAHVVAIKKQTGSLEDVRLRLGLSQRKICQLLMVDPSAWSRWTRENEDAPPHIYRSLQWFLALNEKIPGLTPQYFIGKDPEVLHQVALKRIQESNDENLRLKTEISHLRALLSQKNGENREKYRCVNPSCESKPLGFYFDDYFAPYAGPDFLYENQSSQ